MANSKPRNVIIDVDVGTDDAWAVLMLLRFEQEFEIKVRAITCVHGNTDVKNVASNLIRVLSTVHRLDIPIYLGADERLIPIESTDLSQQFHGSNGFGDYQFVNDICIWEVVKKEHAVCATKYILMNNDDVSLICVGPLTNLALLLKMFPEVKPRICGIYIMGGNRSGVGNVTRAAEFNFFADPEAAHIVFDSFKSNIVLLPWETCMEPNVQFSLDWRFNTLGAISNPITDLLNPVEKVCYKKFKTFTPCDAFLAAVFIDPKLIRKSSQHHVAIELHGRHTRGQVVLDHLFKEKPNCMMVEIIDEGLFEKMILKTAGHNVE